MNIDADRDMLSIALPHHIETPRLLMRSYQLADASVLTEMFIRERDRLRDDFPSRASLTTEAEVETFIIQTMRQWRARTAVYFSLWTKTSPTFVGEVGMKEIVWTIPKADLSYFLTKEEEGKGLATEAVRALVGLAFETLHMNKLQIRCAVENVRSQRVAERCGFLREGVLRSDAIRADGKTLVDLVYYGITPQDVASRPPSSHD